MENPEVKWKQFLFIPGGSRMEAKSCWCQRAAHSWAFVLLFLSVIIFLSGPKKHQLDGLFYLELLKMAYGLFYSILNFTAFCGTWGDREHLPVCRQIVSLTVPQQDASITSLLLW